jgi:MFS family permease
MAVHAAVNLEGDTWQGITRPYAWVVFAMTFGLLLSDYMSRQVLNAVFPLLKAEWLLSDIRLGALGGIVALTVGLLTIPLSLLADRFGRVRSLTVMAVLWSLATLACGLARNYEEMFAARLFVGIGEAAYGSVGIAVVLSVFPPSLRATLTGAFMAGGMFGSVLGMGFGGVLADLLGWRWAFIGMALFGLTLALLYPVIVKSRRVEAPVVRRDDAPLRQRLATLVGCPSVIAAYIGSGLQLFIGGAVLAWIPSYLNRYYHMNPGAAGVHAAGFVLASGVGMVLCGMLSDRLCHQLPERKIALAIGYCLLSFALLFGGFRMTVGTGQLVVLAVGMFFAAGTTGPAGAMVANLTHVSIHGTAFATLTLVNNLLGLAPGPFLTGQLADALGLDRAFQLIPLVSLGAALAFYIGKLNYRHDLDNLAGLGHTSGAPGTAKEPQS